MAKFPLGKVPALETPSGFCLTESTVIAEYIAKHGPAKEQLLGGTPEEEALVNQFLSFLEMHLRPSTTTLIAWRLGGGEFDMKAEAKAADEILRWLKYYEGVLKVRKWLVSDTKGPSLADLVTADVFNFAFMAYIDAEMRKEYPSIVAWYERVQAVPELEGMYTGNMVEEKKVGPAS